MNCYVNVIINEGTKLLTNSTHSYTKIIRIQSFKMEKLKFNCVHLPLDRIFSLDTQQVLLYGTTSKPFLNFFSSKNEILWQLDVSDSKIEFDRSSYRCVSFVTFYDERNGVELLYLPGLL